MLFTCSWLISPLPLMRSSRPSYKAVFTPNTWTWVTQWKPTHPHPCHVVCNLFRINQTPSSGKDAFVEIAPLFPPPPSAQHWLNYRVSSWALQAHLHRASAFSVASIWHPLASESTPSVIRRHRHSGPFFKRPPPATFSQNLPPLAHLHTTLPCFIHSPYQL